MMVSACASAFRASASCKACQRRVEGIERVAHIQAEIQRDLVVARARRVQTAAGGSDQLGQPALDVEVDVLELGREDEASALDLGQHLVQARG